jgi:hypothetical protein
LEVQRLAPWVAVHAGDQRTSTCRLLDAEAMALAQGTPANEPPRNAGERAA